MEVGSILAITVVILFYFDKITPTCEAPAKPRPMPRKQPMPSRSNGRRFEGDILLPSGSERAGTGDKRRIWPRRTVYYQYADHFNNFNQRKKVEDAMKVISCVTCVNFVYDVEPERKDFVLITKNDSGCFSSVGRIGRRGQGQQMNFSPGDCFEPGPLLHELVHSVGFWHEHSRPDRDEWIDVDLNVVFKEYYPNFLKLSPNQWNGFGTEYDYGSIMQYDAYAFSFVPFVRSLVPLKPLNGKVMGQRVALSETDILEINRMYNCTDY